MEQIENFENGANGARAEGNTKKRTSASKCWSFTWNNYPTGYKELLVQKFCDFIKTDYFIFQQEIGEQGTPHIQGMIKLNEKARWTEFKLPKTIHWEKARNEYDLYNYCRKEETRAGETTRWFRNNRIRERLLLRESDVKEYLIHRLKEDNPLKGFRF